jgi:DNA invertase Pin-like site-specific DNA recombinase
MGWLAEDESKKKSERIRASIRKRNGKTISYKGNRWGRKGLPKQTKDRIIELHLQGKSIRDISAQVFYTDKNKNMKPVSKSAVHKTLAQFFP